MIPNVRHPSKSHKQLTSPYQNKITLHYLNVRSIFSEEKFPNFKSYIEENTHIDIFLISETWLSNYTNDSLYIINGYDFYR